MLKKFYCLILFPVLSSSCEDGTIGNDADVEQDDIIDESDQNEDGLIEISDIDVVDIHPDALDEAEDELDDMLPSTCGTMMLPGCGEGRLCIQTLPPYCNTGEYSGYCMTIPTDCSDIPENIVCTCDTLIPYRNDCEARMAGYGGLLVECP